MDTDDKNKFETFEKKTEKSKDRFDSSYSNITYIGHVHIGRRSLIHSDSDFQNSRT